jgi:regulator of replication initiation timing
MKAIAGNAGAYFERIKALKQRAASVPQEAAELDARIERLRERLKNGGLDLRRCHRKKT